MPSVRLIGIKKTVSGLAYEYKGDFVRKIMNISQAGFAL